MKESFVFYRSFYEALSDLKANDKAKLLDAICELALNGEDVELTGVPNTIFKLIRPQLIANNERYSKGFNGGRPTEYNREEIEHLIMQGLSNNEVSNVIGCSYELVKKVRQKLGNNSGNNSVKTEEKKETKPVVEEPVGEIFIKLILNDKSMHPIYENELEEWKTIYPAVDVEQEFRNMKGWLDSNPSNRKTKTGIKRFINGWLSKVQNRTPKSSPSCQENKGKPIKQETSLDASSLDINSDEFLEYLNRGVN